MSKHSHNDKFNYWTLLSQVNIGSKHEKWLARCVCGKEKEVFINHLMTGKSISCSCVSKHTHGMANTGTYRSWSCAKYRCTNPNDRRWDSYGGRGIKMCDRWMSFDNFLEDMGIRPDGLSLDRIDVNGNYEPSNCRWATDRQQYDNTQFNTKLGIDCSLHELAKRYGLSYATVQSRIYRGWSVEDTINTPDTKKDVTAVLKNNTSGVRGISWDKHNKKWSASVRHKHKTYFLGRFLDKVDAENELNKKRSELGIN